MSNLTSVTDLLQDILARGGEPTDTTSDFYNTALSYLNKAWLAIIKGQIPTNPDRHVNFKWAVKYPPGNFIIQPKETTASTVSLTNNSTTATFSSSITTDVAGWHLLVDDEEDVYRITTHGGSTDTATLDSVFTGTTNSSATFKLIKIEYELGSNDIIRLISPFRMFRYHSMGNGQAKIYGIADGKFDELYPLRDIRSGVPEAFKVVKESSNNFTIILNKYSSSDKIKVEYDFIELPSSDLTTGSADSDILVPRNHRGVISDLAVYYLLRDKSDTRMNQAVQEAQVSFDAMVKDHKYTAHDIDPSFAQIPAREEDRLGSNEGPLRTESGAIIG